jgi:HPt (histidine-containing phosphotransfer) domain-containing protein
VPIPLALDEAIDHEALAALEALEGGASFVDRLIEGYLVDTEEQLTLIRGHAPRHAWNAVRDALHAIKGSSGSVGALGMMRLCMALRACTDAELTASAERLVPLLEQGFAAARRGLASYQASPARGRAG